ncbi:hypothetical protein ABW21_db0206451 [Orbilia brochopaga]|nr:hypothetical protein ABW21_db0206451 [Drechslerella brochopaga]
MSLESLPYDVFFRLLSAIDDKADLNRFCAALPLSAGAIIAADRTIVDRLYWEEIQEHFLRPAALLAHLLDPRREAASELLAKLYPQEKPRKAHDDDNDTDDDNGDSDDDDDAFDPISAFLPMPLPEAEAVSLPDDIDDYTAQQMLSLHRCAEHLAETYTTYTLRKHHPPPSTYRSPTSEERRRVIRAVYNSWVALSEHRCQIELELMPPRNVSHADSAPGARWNLNQMTWSWTFWEVKEAAAVSNILFREIPRRIVEEATGVEAWWKRKNWLLRGIGDATKLRVNNATHLLDMLYTPTTYDMHTHLRFLRCHGDSHAAAAFLADALATEGVMRMNKLAGGLDPYGITGMNLLDEVERKLAATTATSQLREVWGSVFRGASTDFFSAPPARRLVRGGNAVLGGAKLLEQADTGTVIGAGGVLGIVAGLMPGKVAENWTAADVVVLSDCLWDEWRLEGWGYGFPLFVGGEPHVKVRNSAQLLARLGA